MDNNMHHTDHEIVGYTEIPVTLVPEGIDAEGRVMFDVMEVVGQDEGNIRRTVGCKVCSMPLAQMIETGAWKCPGRAEAGAA